MRSKWELDPRRIDFRELGLYLRECKGDVVESVAIWQHSVQGRKRPAVEANLDKGRPAPSAIGPRSAPDPH